MNNPLVSIIIPTFNRAQLICETLESVFLQTYKNWECLIIDDGSTDETSKIIQNYLKSDSRFQYHHRPDDCPKGGNTCRNYGFKLSKGDYIKWFDSDDIMYPDFIQKQVEALNSDATLDFCACQGEYFYDDNRVVNEIITTSQTKNPIYSYFIEGHLFLTPSPLWRRSFLINKDLFDLNLFRSQEADFHFRMLTFNPKYKIIDKVLFKVRRGHDSIDSNAHNLEAQQSVFIYFQKAFSTVKKLNFPNKKIVLKYLIYRNMNQFYNLVATENNFLKRIKYLYFYKNIMCYYSYIDLLTYIRLSIGFISLIFFKKGYHLTNLNKYDLRIKGLT